MVEEVWYAGPVHEPRRYRVTRPTSFSGGQSYVFRAFRTEGGSVHEVALKIVDPDSTSSERHLAVDEALLGLTGPGLASIVDVFEGAGLWRGEEPPADAFDLQYIVSEWVDGEPMSRVAPLPAEAAAVVIEDIAAAVAALHAKGYVHADLHPGNVIVTPEGRAVVIDLASARVIGSQGKGPPTGVLGFVPPDGYADADARADRWSVGMLAVFVLLGHPQGRHSLADVTEELGQILGGGPGRRAALSLMEGMIDPDPDRRPGDLPSWAAGLSGALVEERTGRRRWSGAVAAVVVVALVSVAIWALTGHDRRPARSAPAPNAAACAHRLGVEGADVEAGALTRFRATAGRALPTACADGPVTPFGKALYQRFRDGDATGVAILSPGTSLVRLTEAQWASYYEMAGRARPENAILFGGYPREVLRTDDGIVMALTQSGEIVGPRSDSQSFWMPEQVLTAWRANGGLAVWGYPTSNPYFEPGGLLQDFERGYFEVPHAPVPLEETTAAMVVVHRVADRAAPTAGVGEVRGRILRQRTGTAWYIDASGRRRWIKDGATWNCLGGDGNVAGNDLPGWAVAVHRLGPPAACPGTG